MTTPLENMACPTCAFLSLQPDDPATTRTARVEELLCRNQAPLEAELPDFRLIVENSPDIIHGLDQKIIEAKELVDRLVRARAQAESNLADAKSLLHPMRSLSNELLGEIFSHCVWTWDTAKGEQQQPDALAPSSTPWTLTYVCRRWRHLALALPHLWTYIEVHFDQFPEDVTPRQIAFKMALLIERSKGLPLSLSITASTYIEDDSLIPILEASIPRWKHLSVNVPLDSLQLCFSGNVFWSLEHLILVLDEDVYPNNVLDIFNPTNAPALRTLEAKGLDQTYSHYISLPLDSLTHFENLLIWRGAFELLQTMSSLKSLSVTTWALPSENIRISLPELHRLVVTVYTLAAEVSDKLFSAVDMPALSDLTLKFCLHIISRQLEDSSRAIHFPVLNPRSVETLRKLHISCAVREHPDTTQNILRFLSQTPHIENLCISDCNLDPEFISGLQLSSRLPRLRILDISDTRCGGSLAQNMSVIYDTFESWCLDVVAPGRHIPNTNDMDVGLQESSYPRHVRLETLRVPRWLYFKNDERWKVIRRSLKVECGITMHDVD